MKQSHILYRVLTLMVIAFQSILYFDANAQTSLKLSNREINFGRIASVANPAKTIEFTNRGKDKLAILLIEKGPDVKVNFERRFYQPGETGLIYVYYNVRNVGEINEELRIYNNADTSAQVVKLTGTCVSVQECFPDINNLNLRNITVVNKVTQTPIPMASLTFVRNHNTSNPVTFSVDRTGKATEEIPIGLYNISATVDGYEPYSSEMFIPKTQPIVLIELSPVTAEVTKPAAIPSVQTDATTPAVVTSVELPENKYAANNIVLLLDVSSSMRSGGKFGLLQQSVNNLVLILRPIDYVSIITYASDARVVLQGNPGNEKEKITGIVQDLIPSGSTQGVKGLNTAYEMALNQFIEGGNNQVILATDGEFSEKGLTDEYYQKFIGDYAQKGVKLSILGFGVNSQAISRMKKMVTSGEGSFILVDSEKYIKTALIDEIKEKSFMKN